MTDGVNKYFRGFEIIKNDDDIYYFYNGQGDVSVLTDNAGNTVASYIFDAYGNQSEENTVYNPFGYRGEYTDSESELVYLRARMYDSETGRFVNEDPARDGLNWYLYAESNPILFVDPSGHESYVFYTTGKNSDFSRQANWQKSFLQRSGEKVIMKKIDTVKAFTSAWDSIGLDDSGNTVSVNKVIIYTHSNDRTLILLDGSSTQALSIDGKNSAGKAIGNLSELKYKYINELQLLSCNAGHLDPYYAGNSNVASVMSKRIAGVTYAYDGNVAFGRPAWKLWGEDIGLSSRLSTTQNSFNKITSYYGKSGREPRGKLTYFNGEYMPYGYYYGTSIQPAR
ncbi:MAG: RHS repeat-associated core domain-containing protein [Firmicutes bacterium]|nr:RHS repeat-associated core domain-containing protein [Bacillota bacterium]